MNGFKQIDLVIEPDQLLKMSYKKRNPFFLLDEARMTKIADQLKLDPSLFEKALFAFNVTDNMAFSKNTSPELVKKVRDAYQALVKDGKIRSVVVSTVGE